jgi:hypothetical protein
MNERNRPKAASQSLSADQDLKSTLGHAGDNAALDAPGEPMTKADRANLERLARKRGKVATARVAERVKVLQADVEDQLSANYKFDDPLWADLTRTATAGIAEVDAKVAARCRQLGIPEDFRPGIDVVWHGRGENGLASRRAELRKLAHARIDAAAESAKVAIEAGVVEVETALIVGGLETAEAARFVVESMPTPEQLMPQVNVGELKPGQSRSRYDSDEWRGNYDGWTPPPDAAAALLTPTTAAGREAKRQAFDAVLAANPEQSNRELGRLAGVDHKTVGKWRTEGGELPSESGEIPSGDEVGGGTDERL